MTHFQYYEKEDTPNNTDTLTQEEIELVIDVLAELKHMNPNAYHKAKRVKRADLLTWFLGWGVCSNSRKKRKLRRIYLSCSNRIKYKASKSDYWLSI